MMNGSFAMFAILIFSLLAILGLGLLGLVLLLFFSRRHRRRGAGLLIAGLLAVGLLVAGWSVGTVKTVQTTQHRFGESHLLPQAFESTISRTSPVPWHPEHLELPEQLRARRSNRNRKLRPWPARRSRLLAASPSGEISGEQRRQCRRPRPSWPRPTWIRKRALSNWKT